MLNKESKVTSPHYVVQVLDFIHTAANFLQQLHHVDHNNG